MRCGATGSCIVNERGCAASENDGVESVSWAENPRVSRPAPSASAPVPEWLLTTYTTKQNQGLQLVYVKRTAFYAAWIAVFKRGGGGQGRPEARPLSTHSLVQNFIPMPNPFHCP